MELIVGGFAVMGEDVTEDAPGLLLNWLVVVEVVLVTEFVTEEATELLVADCVEDFPS